MPAAENLQPRQHLAPRGEPRYSPEPHHPDANDGIRIASQRAAPRRRDADPGGHSRGGHTAHAAVRSRYRTRHGLPALPRAQGGVVRAQLQTCDGALLSISRLGWNMRPAEAWSVDKVEAASNDTIRTIVVSDDDSLALKKILLSR